MKDLSSRQVQILKLIIDEYVNTAEPVGSENLEKKYNLTFSPATIRNEMVKLTELGYLKQPHKSAGRVPTPMALKYYVRNILQPEVLPISEEVSVKQRVWDHRHSFDKLVKEATQTLAEKTKALAISSVGDDFFYYAGSSNILDFPEFYDIDLTKHLLALLDHFDFWQNIFSKPVTQDPFNLLLGDELGESMFEPCGFLYTRFKSPSHEGTIGVVGPYRLNYGRVIPMVRYFGNLLSELG